MLSELIQSLGLAALLNLNVPSHNSQTILLAEHQINLENRQVDRFVNGVFKDNILLNLALMKSPVDPKKIDWNQINQPFHYDFDIEPKQTFAYHSDVLDKYEGKIAKTTNAHFNSFEGFKSDGYLVGDGVCHLASLFNWAARDAALEVESPRNHNFAVIPEIPREFGVAIYADPSAKGVGAVQNLYITNQFSEKITFSIDYQENNLKVSVFKHLN